MHSENLMFLKPRSHRRVRQAFVMALLLSLAAWMFSVVYVWQLAKSSHWSASMMNGALTVHYYVDGQSNPMIFRPPNSTIPRPYLVGVYGVTVAPKLRLGLRWPSVNWSLALDQVIFESRGRRLYSPGPPSAAFVLPLWLPAVVSLAGLLLLASCNRLHLTNSIMCKQCQYDLTGNVSGVCPECGLVLTNSLQVNDRNLPK